VRRTYGGSWGGRTNLANITGWNAAEVAARSAVLHRIDGLAKAEMSKNGDMFDLSLV
jgi:hypothetical protein